MSEYPHFFEVNKINKDQDTISASSGDGVVENCVDYDKNTEWESVGSDDTTTETITNQFKDADGGNENRDIDRCIITGCNAKLFRIYTAYWNGAAYDAWVLQDTVTDSVRESYILSFTSVSAGQVKIEMDTTIVADEQKTISAFIMTVLIWEATMPMDIFSIKNKQKTSNRRLYNGTGQRIVQYDKWASAIEFRQISKTELNSLKDIYDNYNSFIVIVEPYDYLDAYDKPEDYYRVLWMSPWQQKYFTKIKSAGYNIKIQLEEV